MKSRFITLPLLAITLAGCDKAKNLANEAASAVKERINSPANTSNGTSADPELGKLVDQTAEGAVFRKDLPFPARLEVRTTLRREISGRLFQSSAIDRKTEIVKGTQVTVRKIQRDGDRVSHTLEQANFSTPALETKDAKKDAAQIITDPLKQVAPTHKPMMFRLTGKSWKTEDTTEFRSVAISRQLSPVFDDLLVENLLSPRRMWFSTRRLKVGDEFVATGESLPMLLTGNATGSLKLKLESFEAVEGHPCGVFSIKGSYTRKQFPDFEGAFTDEDVTIESGKIWLSLIHPLILRQEFDTIQSFKTGGHGGQAAHGQGTVKVSMTCSWKAL